MRVKIGKITGPGPAGSRARLPGPMEGFVMHSEYPGLTLVKNPETGINKKIVCNICGREWALDVGRKAGFVKSGAEKHGFSCWESALKKQGLKLGKYINGIGYEILTA
jgi:ABC-type nitrate/sulfonate/bicarbonate transport system substrate-binding protein